MANTFTFIAESVISTPTATITFSSIPSTYRHLCLFMSPRSDTSTGSRDLTIVMNGNNTGSSQALNYTYSDAGSAAASYSNARADLLLNDSVPGSDYTANVFGGVEFWVHDYSNTSHLKLPFDIATNKNTGSNIGRVTAHAHYWNYTAAVSSIAITCQGNWETNSTARLYGIKSA